jgi:hypothetical protein
MGYWIVNGKQMSHAEYEEFQKQEQEAKQQVQQEAAALVKKLGQTYEELTGLLQQNPELARHVTDGTAAEEEIYRKLRRNLERADGAPRCRWVKQGGTGCGSPQMRKHIYCYAHKQMMQTRALTLRLPALEDANAIQIAVMQVQTALIDDTISERKAGLLLYSLQLAMTNIGKTTFGQAEDGELVTETVDEDEALSQDRGLPLTSTEGTDEKGLPRMSADERGSGAGERQNLVAMRT